MPGRNWKSKLCPAMLIAGFFLAGIAAAATPTQLIIAAGDKQTAPANTRVPNIVCVKVLDADNKPVPGVEVTWGDVVGGGSLITPIEPTDATGIATLGGWILGPTAGANSTIASSPGLPSVTFTADATAPLPPDNVVIQWNDQLLLSFQLSNTAPTVASRALGVLHTSIFDAWAAYDEKAVGTQLGGTLRRPAAERTDANKSAAISFAAYRTLVDLFPAQKGRFDALMATLALDPADMSQDPATPAGIGNLASAANIAFRHADGSNQLGDLNPGPYSDYTSYVPKNDVASINDPNSWQPLLNADGTVQKFTTPHWGLVKTFAIGDKTQRKRIFPKPPKTVDLKTYKKQAEEILELSANLDDRTKTIGAYWIDKAFTVTPPGHWALFAQFVSRRDHHTLDDDVKLFFALGNAELDAGVEVWDIKRFYDSVRPVTAIHYLYKGQNVQAWSGPGNGTQSILGENWQTYIVTPPFAEYISGHSTFSATGAEVLKKFTKSSKFGLAVTIPPGYTTIEPNVPAERVTFFWQNFLDAANDAGISRRIGGIHFKDGDLNARKIGKTIGGIVFKKAQEYISGKVKPAKP